MLSKAVLRIFSLARDRQMESEGRDIGLDVACDWMGFIPLFTDGELDGDNGSEPVGRRFAVLPGDLATPI
jgi:hypothetical protein